ncbi:hypothetical protein [Thalassotalea piscium]|uniref:Uncharacterized protein n=1 Tax=Thalassotalea piscium TaxID=1230533 RepID=A0A7X0NH71_9GAMM|nr:hypothetical protein [Thalassotalea piscium]MBB6543367.1 hypothetical protein [Thalassotalea piscium]
MKEYYSIDELSNLWKIPAVDILYTIQSKDIPAYIRYCGYIRIINSPNPCTLSYHSSFLKMWAHQVENFYFNLIERNENQYKIFSFSTENSDYIGDRLISVSSKDITNYSPSPDSYKKLYQEVTLHNVFIYRTDFSLFGLSLTHINGCVDFSDKERKNLYKTIGLLTKALTHSKGNILGDTEKPVINQVAIELSKYLPDDDTGLKDRALRERISKGLNYLKDI